MLDFATICSSRRRRGSRSRRGYPAQAVDAKKQRKLTFLAVTFLKRHRLLEYPGRSTWWRSPGRAAAAGRRSRFSKRLQAMGSGSSICLSGHSTGFGETATLPENYPGGPQKARSPKFWTIQALDPEDPTGCRTVNLRLPYAHTDGLAAKRLDAK